MTSREEAMTVIERLPLMNTDPNGFYAASQSRRLTELQDERDALADALGRTHQQLQGAVDALEKIERLPDEYHMVNQGVNIAESAVGIARYALATLRGQ